MVLALYYFSSPCRGAPGAEMRWQWETLGGRLYIHTVLIFPYLYDSHVKKKIAIAIESLCLFVHTSSFLPTLVSP